MDALLVALVAGAVAILIAVLGRLWLVRDRKRQADLGALDAAVQRLMAWQDMAVKLLAGSDISESRRRLLELDAKWEADITLIPDQEAVQEMLRLSKSVYLSGGGEYYRHSEAGRRDFDRLTTLLPRVLESAAQKRRDLS